MAPERDQTVSSNGVHEATAVRDPTTSEAKRTEQVGVETATHSVIGTVTLPADGYRARFSDYLNRQDIDYISLTDVEKTPLSGGSATSHAFLAVARKAIVFGYSLERDAG
jgi:Family of unknown function (DUF6812)